MPKKLDLPIVKRTLNLFEGDVDLLQRYYGRVGWSPVVRQLVHNHVKRLRERENRNGVVTNERAETAALAAELDIALDDLEPAGDEAGTVTLADLDGGTEGSLGLDTDGFLADG